MDKVQKLRMLDDQLNKARSRKERQERELRSTELMIDFLSQEVEDLRGGSKPSVSKP